jgi:hypothetical protein
VLASGTWTSGYLPKINGTYTIGNSLVQDNGSTVSISTGSTVLSIDRTGGATALLELKTGGTVRGYLGADASMPFVFYNQSPTALMYLNSSGNLGLGVTPSAWSGFPAMQFTSNFSISALGTGKNAYFDGTDYRYISTNYASLFQQTSGGVFAWLQAPSGTAGNAITFTQAMTLLANGNLGVGIATPLSILHIEKSSQDNILAVIGQSGYEGALFLSSAGSGKDANIVVGNNRNLEFHTSSSATPVVDGTLRMTLTSSGVLTLPTTGSLEVGYSATQGLYKLDVNGTGRFITSLTIGAGASQANIYLNRSATTSVENAIRWQTNGTSDWYLGSAASGANSDLEFYNYGIGAVNFKLTRSTGAATFSSSVTASEMFIGSTSGFLTLGSTTSYGRIGSGGGGVTMYLNGATRGGGGYAASGTCLISLDGQFAVTDSSTAVTKFRVETNGNVLIGTTTDAGTGKLQVNGCIVSSSPGGGVNAATFYDRTGAVGAEVNQYGTLAAYSGILNNNGDYASGASGTALVFKAGSVEQFRISATNMVVIGSVTATSFFESSDSRLKTLIQDNYQTKGIASITPKLYTKNGKVELGYYAQDFVGILDSAVSKGSDDMLSLSYREVLVAKVYALEQEIKELKGRKFNISTTKLK